MKGSDVLPQSLKKLWFCPISHETVQHRSTLATPGLVSHPKLLMFATGGPDNIKQWKCPDGKFIQVAPALTSHLSRGIRHLSPLT